LGIFDGHGGWQVAEMCNRKMHKYLDTNLKGAKSEESVKNAINKAFDDCENELLGMAR